MKSVDFHFSIKRDSNYADVMDRVTDQFGITITGFLGKCENQCCSNFVGRFKYHDKEAFSDLLLFFDMHKDDYEVQWIKTNAPALIRDVFNEITKCYGAGSEINNETLSKRTSEIAELIHKIRGSEAVPYDGENEVHQFFVKGKFVEINNNGALSVSEKGNVLFPEPPDYNPILAAIFKAM